MLKALISVSDKTGLKELGLGLESLGYEIISTGGTYKTLEEAGIKNLKKVEEITNFPEIMDGRVKTLNPKIFGGILADRSKADHLKQAEENDIEMIEVVVCNLYPFQDKASIENIDIGGPSLLRAAAKNYQHITVVCDSADYKKVLAKLKEDDLSFRKELAQKVFEHTTWYDSMIARYFSDNQDLNLGFKKLYDLRYGENPYQQAALYKEIGFNSQLASVINAEVLHGKQLSYNNIIDVDSALNIISEFDDPAAAVLKHTNPCGVAEADDITEAFTKAYAADSLSAFGGIIVLNRQCNKKIAEEINKVFAEIVIAPDFEKEALEILQQKKNIRLLKSEVSRPVDLKLKDYKKVVGGILEQDFDDKKIAEKDLDIITKLKPQASEMKDLLFAWRVAKHVKSNAIVFVKDGVTVGIGAGQMSRIDAVEIAVKKSGENIKGCVMASDGFFPFRDGIDRVAKIGVKSVIQPGGSINDKEVIQAADEQGLSMAFTGFRAFRH